MVRGTLKAAIRVVSSLGGEGSYSELVEIDVAEGAEGSLHAPAGDDFEGVC